MVGGPRLPDPRGDGDVGIQVTGSRSIRIGNACGFSGTNDTISVGNSVGTVIAAGTNAFAVNGSSAAAVIGSTDPWANVSY